VDGVNTITDTQTDYWLAWQDGIPLEQMKRVVWVETLPDGSKVHAWLQADDFTQLWDPLQRKFVPR
jgi:hypothetical protein